MTHYIWKKVKTVEFSEDTVEVNENVINIQDIFLVLEKKKLQNRILCPVIISFSNKGEMKIFSSK